MSPKSILLVAMLALTAAGCHRSVPTTSVEPNKIPTTPGVIVDVVSPATPYIDSLLATRTNQTASLSAERENITTPSALPTQPPQPRSRIQPHREHRVAAMPIHTSESRSLDLPPVRQVSEQVAAPPAPNTPAAIESELTTASVAKTTTVSYSPPVWPRKLGTLKLQCGHAATVWLLDPDRAVLTTEKPCKSGDSFNVQIVTSPHPNARTSSTYSGEPGWTLTYCDRCCKYFLIRQ